MALVIYYAYQMHRAAKVAVCWAPANGWRKTGRPTKTWLRTFQQGLQMVDFKWEEVEYVATDRSKWRQLKLLPDVPNGTGGTKSNWLVDINK